MTTKLPQHAIELLREGRKIEAIKAAREKLGLGLKEAKALVDACELGGATGHDETPGDGNELPGAAIKALRRGRLVDAVKHVRKHSTLGLKDAKDQVDRYLQSNPQLNDQYQAAIKESRHQLVGKLVTLFVLFGAIFYVYRFFFTE